MLSSTLTTFALVAFSFSLPTLAADPKIGYSGTLSSLDGGLGGTVTVVDATTLKISGYKLEDASAPALYWWGATDDNLSGGFRISNAQVTSRAASDSLTIKLDAGKTTADFVTVGLWCEKFSADFGQARLTANGGGAPASGTTSGAPAVTTAAKPGAGASNSVPYAAVGALAIAVAVAACMS
jgi:hypothetical protein